MPRRDGTPTTTERGYGSAHQRKRDALLPHAYGQPCPMCGRVMVYGQALDLDHTVPLALGGRDGDRIAHARCNRSRGARVRVARARARRRGVSRLVTSRSF